MVVASGSIDTMWMMVRKLNSKGIPNGDDLDAEDQGCASQRMVAC